MQRSVTLPRNARRPFFFVFCGFILFFTIYVTEIVPSSKFAFTLYQSVVGSAYTVVEDKGEFEEFSSVTGARRFIVPNIIHFIRFNNFELNFVDYVVLLAAMRNQRPEKIYIHTNIQDVQYTGKYWDWVQQNEELWMRIEVLYLEAPTEIFGQKLSEGWRFHHGSDIGRMLVLMKYGGIYLDNDAFVIRSLDKYRKYECVINWDEKRFIGNQVIIAHKDARFLALWLDSYRFYRSDLWYGIYCSKI